MTAAVLSSFYYGHRTMALVGAHLCFGNFDCKRAVKSLFRQVGEASHLEAWGIQHRNMNLATIVSFGLLLLVMAVPALRNIFNVELMHLHDWDITLLIAAMPLIFGELTKVVKNAVLKSK